MRPHNDTHIENRFILSIVLTALILVAEIIGGIWTGSLSLLSDSAHVFLDLFALGLSFLALKISSLPSDDRHSYGWHRLEVIAALINGVTLVIVAGGIFWKAVERFQSPQPIKSVEMLIIAAIGLVINLVVALLLGHPEAHEDAGHHHKDLNLHSAFLHVLGDLLSSIGVIAAAIIISFTGWNWVDPAASILIGLIILFGAYRVTRKALHILNEGVPEGISLQEISQHMVQIPGVNSIHDLHVWNICSEHIALSAHVVCDGNGSTQPQDMRNQLNHMLMTSFGIQHTTLQLEDHPCLQASSGCGSSM